MAKIQRILVDQDEVFTDFISGACGVWGKSREEVIRYWTAGEWDIVPPLSTALGYTEHSKMTEEHFWAPIKGNSNFWAKLQPLPWFVALKILLDSTNIPWYIVTTPYRCPSSYAGKIEWLLRYFGSGFDNMVLTKHKHLLAQPGVLLIDDKDDNVSLFQQKSGAGIVFPRHHNFYHRYQDDPIWFLSRALKSFIRS